jgi:glutaredoxin-related protein
MYGKHPFYADKKISSISQLVGELKKNNVNYKYENLNPHIKNLIKRMLQI